MRQSEGSKTVEKVYLGSATVKQEKSYGKTFEFTVCPVSSGSGGGRGSDLRLRVGTEAERQAWCQAISAAIYSTLLTVSMLKLWLHIE